MRLWTINPKYLDAKGLLALWREALLAQEVLRGRTKGWRNHPQLDRFKSHPDPVSAIGFYLYFIYLEGKSRGYRFNEDKIYRRPKCIPAITVSRKWLAEELKQLKRKLRERDRSRYLALLKTRKIELHPLFQLSTRRRKSKGSTIAIFEPEK
ncbi:MAG: pyrimidine dimer DNA glycosylase/endonuclease V [Candidatus Hadarchaeum sp.]|uniref:pyrimidine dimer DNA glycosylase/endonuclease V n=1 Tax=Candidatus Hadarchaeum sp. TaxID=2883567 RepID=UPI003D0A136F